jgi:hypothetical protein
VTISTIIDNVEAALRLLEVPPAHAPRLVISPGIKPRATASSVKEPTIALALTNNDPGKIVARISKGTCAVKAVAIRVRFRFNEATCGHTLMQALVMPNIFATAAAATPASTIAVMRIESCPPKNVAKLGVMLASAAFSPISSISKVSSQAPIPFRSHMNKLSSVPPGFQAQYQSQNVERERPTDTNPEIVPPKVQSVLRLIYSYKAALSVVGVRKMKDTITDQLGNPK